MKNKFFLCFRPLDVAEDSLILKHDVDHHSSSRKKHHKENPTLKTKGKRRKSSRKDKSISKASSSSSELSYSTSSLSSSTSSSSTEDDLSISNSNSSYEQKEAKYGPAKCDNLLVMKFSSFCLYFFVFVLFLLIYMGKVSSIVVTSVGLIVFSLVGRLKSENPPPEMKNHNKEDKRGCEFESPQEQGVKFLEGRMLRIYLETASLPKGRGKVCIYTTLPRPQ